MLRCERCQIWRGVECIRNEWTCASCLTPEEKEMCDRLRIQHDQKENEDE